MCGGVAATILASTHASTAYGDTMCQTAKSRISRSSVQDSQ
ncbi:MAG: hypothetical protein ACLSCB_05270 [Bifidobacterium pseudocatenulatum]